jgi:hypothetical protein
MEYFTNSKPTLISDKTVTMYKKMIDDITYENSSIFKKIYDKIIYPNLGLFIIIIIIVVVLIYMYKRHRENFSNNHNNHNNHNRHSKMLIDPMDENKFMAIDHPRERIARPTFNPYYPVAQQVSHVNYLPDQIPVQLNGGFINNTGNTDYDPTAYYANEYEKNENNPIYSGPFYSGSSINGGVSDDSYKNFVSANANTLDEYNTIIGDKQIIESPFDK